MRPFNPATWLLAILLTIAPLSVTAAPSFEALLREADAIRTSDTVRFGRIVTQLDRMVAAATPDQREQLQYMRAHKSMMAGDFEATIATLEALQGQTRSVDLKYRSSALLVNSYAAVRRFPEGLAVLDRMLKLKGSVRDSEIRHQGLLAAAILYNQVDQYRLGQQYAEQLLAESVSGRTRCLAGNLRIESLQRLSRPAGDDEIAAVIALCRLQREGILVGFAHGNLARKRYGEGKVDAAISLLEAHLSEVEATHYPRLIAEIHSLLAEYSFSSGNVVAAEHYAQAAIAQSAGIAYSLPVVTAYKTQYEIAQQRGEAVAALANYKRYAEADKAYLNDVKLRELAFQLVQQETLQKTQAIDLLNRQNQVLQLQQRVDKQATQNSRLLVLLLAVLLASIGYWAYKIKRVQMSLRQMAETDALTGICNRHHFTQQSEQTLAQCQKAGEDAALLMFDLDFFKSINDRYGHVTGDWVLRQVAVTCSTFCRKIDHFGRIGGEEFALLIYGCDLRAATRLAEDCRVRIAAIDTRETGHVFTATASFGVTATTLSGYDLNRLMSHADEMLYRAKREGRNRVRVYDGQPSPIPASGPEPVEVEADPLSREEALESSEPLRSFIA